MTDLTNLGWTAELQESWENGDYNDCVPARVVADFGSVLKTVTPVEVNAQLSGNLVYYSDPAELPKVGDWVAIKLVEHGNALIESVLPRTSAISRKVAGEKIDKQILATNIDVALIVQSADNDFSPERIERYLYQLRSDNIQPVIILNKTDAVDNLNEYTERLKATGVPYVACSAKTGQGVDQILDYLKPGQTAVLLGSSGVGKSTLTNRLIGKEIQKTQEVRVEDNKGRHTTTHRELFALSNGSLLIDTPGVRELQLWGSEQELEELFADIIEITKSCQYRNCGHTSESGCAIKVAIEDNSLDKSHYENYLKMKDELKHLEEKTEYRPSIQKQRATNKAIKERYKQRGTPKKK